MWHHKSVIALFQIVLRLLIDLIALIALAFRQRRATAAEILVLRRQIALYKERGIKPRRIDPVTRISLAFLSRFFHWRDALVVVRPETMIRSTFLRLHAQGIIACDVFLAVTVTFRQLYVFVVIEHHSRRLIHCNVTAHPTAAWTLQQLRESHHDIACAKTGSYVLTPFSVAYTTSISGHQRALIEFLRMTGVLEGHIGSVQRSAASTSPGEDRGKGLRLR
jgi:hypothetical protein